MQTVVYTPDEIQAYELDFGRRMANGDKAAYWEYLEWIDALSRVKRESKNLARMGIN
jgi:hypothetical protein